MIYVLALIASSYSIRLDHCLVWIYEVEGVSMTHQFVREIAFRNQIIYVSHDKRYRYYIEVEGGYVKSAINTKECIEWLMDQMHDDSESK